MFEEIIYCDGAQEFMDNDVKEIINLLEKCIAKDLWFEINNENATKLGFYINKLQQKCEELECDLEDLTFSYNELEKELRDKKEQCSHLMEYVNPYRVYGINESDFH